MFISKKRIQVIERRIADLERQVQGQQKVIDYLHVDVSKNPRQVLSQAVQDALSQNFRGGTFLVH